MISHSSKNRFQSLAGILKENVSLIPSTEGRSDQGTLSWFVEQYIIGLCEKIITNVDDKTTEIGSEIAISQSSTKMNENSFSTILIYDNKKILLTALVNFNQNASTSISVNNKQFILKTHHSAIDVNTLIEDVSKYISDIILTKTY